MIRFVCPNCSNALSAPEGCEGRTSSCRKCGQTIVIPSVTVPPPLPTQPASATILVACPACGKQARVPSQAQGKQASCPFCNTVFPVMANTAIFVGVPAINVSQVQVVSPPPLPRTKPCPFCGQQVFQVALQCQHCGETIDVALRAAEEAKRIAKWSNRYAISQPPDVRMSIATDKSRLTLERKLVRLILSLMIGLMLAFVGFMVLVIEQSGWGCLIAFFALIAFAAAIMRHFHCSFCEKKLQVSCFAERCQCSKCGVVHVLNWKD
jgi:hypothetical protein